MWKLEEKKKFLGLITMLAEFYNKKYSDLLTEIWIEALSLYPFEKVKKAVYKYMLSEKSAPQLIDVIKLVEQIDKLDEEIEILKKIEEKWDKILLDILHLFEQDFRLKP